MKERPIIYQTVFHFDYEVITIEPTDNNDGVSLVIEDANASKVSVDLSKEKFIMIFKKIEEMHNYIQSNLRKADSQ